jgi:hypothetical protein
MQVTLLVGAASFSVEEEEAWWLVHRIRETCVHDSHRPRDASSVACLQLADVLADDLDASSSPEPIELGRTHAVGLTEHVLVPSVVEEHGIRALYEALIRLR